MAVEIRCPLQGCRNSTAEVGQPCEECRELFGSALRETDEPVDPATFQKVMAEGDRRVQQIMAERVGTPYRKANQLCWLCTERRTCTKIDGQWECDACRAVT